MKMCEGAKITHKVEAGSKGGGCRAQGGGNKEEGARTPFYTPLPLRGNEFLVGVSLQGS